MTHEQSAAVEVLAAAIDCFDFENLLGAVPITHDAADDLRDACTPENIRTLLAALDEAQQDAARLQFVADCERTVITKGKWAVQMLTPTNTHQVFYFAQPPGVNVAACLTKLGALRAAIDAARAGGAA